MDTDFNPDVDFLARSATVSRGGISRSNLAGTDEAFDTDGTDFHEPAEPDHNPC